MDYELNDPVFWIKFGVVFVIFAVLPVWVFNLVELSFFTKIMFSLAGGVGAFIAIQGKSMRKN